MKHRPILALCLCSLLAACGQKGPLYLPQEPAQPAPAEQPAPKAETQR